MNNIQSPQTNSHQTAEQLISDGRYKESKEILTKLLIEDPSDHVATHMLGLLAKKTNQWNLAMAFFTRAININEQYFLPLTWSEELLIVNSLIYLTQ